MAPRPKCSETIPKAKKIHRRLENQFKLDFKFSSNIWKMNFHNPSCIKLEDTHIFNFNLKMQSELANI